MKKLLIVGVLSASLLIVAGCGTNGTNTSNNPTVNNTNTAQLEANFDADAVATDIASLAQCMQAKELKMYGTEWCGHCQNQKRMFGDAFAYIEFIDCDQNRQVCQNAGVRGYPTWIDSENNLYPGTQNLERLAQIAGCNYQPNAGNNQGTAQPVPDNNDAEEEMPTADDTMAEDDAMEDDTAEEEMNDDLEVGLGLEGEMEVGTDENE